MKKGNLIALLVFLAAVVMVFTLKTPQTRAVQTWVLGVLSPFIRGGAQAEQQAKAAMAGAPDVAALQSENERLKQEVEKLRIIAQRYDNALVENNKYRAMLAYRQKTDFKLTGARVLRRSASNWWNTIIVDKGVEDGVATDFPVITDIGLVGKTGKVAAHTAEVILLTDEECRVTARVEGPQSQGILAGERGGFETRPELRLRFLDPRLKIEPGANVYSVGVDGGVFPAGLFLGKVKSFGVKDISGEAVVDSAVDFSLLEDVFIVHMDSAEPSQP
jgi:rod shape-determining protein MreC